MAEEKTRKTNYPLAILLNVVSTLLPFAAGGFFAFIYLKKINVSNGASAFGTASETTVRVVDAYPYLKIVAIIAIVISILQWLILRLYLKGMLNKAVMDNEYDENGVSKKKSFANLTRKEREAMDLQKASIMESLLPTTVLKKITKRGSSAPEKDLNDLIGLAPVKQKVTEMVARMKFEQETREESKGRKGDSTQQANSMSGRHFCFYGSAGTGKTTVARILTGFLYQYGYIKENKCIEIDGNFLKAGADSADKTRLIIQKAYGGVLFIDEAYTIIDGSGGYGKEVVATLIKEMEDNRDKLTVIIAGYKNDIRRLLDSNEGFKSRIKEYLEFSDYNTYEMKQIFEAMAHSEGYVVSGEAMENFEVRCEAERRLSSFGNGRTARSVLEESIDRHALNYGSGNLYRTLVDEQGNVQKVTDPAQNKFVLCGCDVSPRPNKATL